MRCSWPKERTGARSPLGRAACFRMQRPQIYRPSMKASTNGVRKGAVIFDLDGTLVDSMPLVIEMFSFAVEPFRERPTPGEVVAQLGGPPDTCVAKLLGSEAIGSLSAAVDRMLHYQRGHLQEVREFAG